VQEKIDNFNIYFITAVGILNSFNFRQLAVKVKML